ncbi:MAG: hypothetical protein ACYS0C_05720 [Planctomycetota bacterium]|jgi:hypothetical protein
MRKPWSEDEIKQLKKLYPVTKTVDLAKQLGRHPAIVSYKARRLGIKKKEGHFFWSAKDIEKLKKLYPQGDQYEVAEAIGRGGRKT